MGEGGKEMEGGGEGQRTSIPTIADMSPVRIRSAIR